MDKAMREITDIRMFNFSLLGSMKRVLWFYTLFLRPPILVIRVPERQQGQQYADVTAAVRGLADEFGLRVIVDGSPNSIPPELQATKRQTNIFIMPMDRGMIESIPEYLNLIEFLREHKLDRAIWEVLGGSPQCYNILTEEVSMLKKNNYPTVQIVEAVKNHIHSILLKALNKNIAKSSSNTKQILKLFRELKVVKSSVSEIEANGFLLDYPNKVFREVETNKHFYVEPTSPAVKLIIAENISNNDDVAALVEKIFVLDCSG
jgi:hypothetical protein